MTRILRFPARRPPSEPLLLSSRVAEGSEEPRRPMLGGGFALLEVPIQFNKYCYSCDSEQLFIAAWEVECGLLAYCVGCGAERCVEFSRTVCA